MKVGNWGSFAIRWIRWWIFSLWLVLPLFAWAKVTINEVLYDPSGTDKGKEWLEIYNDSEASVDLTGWQIYSGGGSFSLDFTFPVCTLAGKSFLLIGAPTFCDLQTEFSFQNGGSETDGIMLMDSQGVCRDVLLYDSSNASGLQVENGQVGTSFAVDVAQGNSLARKIDGLDSDDCMADFRECGKPTPGKSNVEPIIPLIISEIFYNPVGIDGDAEWIEIYNPTDQTVDLQGWQILSAGVSFAQDYIFEPYLLAAKSFVVLGAGDFCDIKQRFSFQNGGSAVDGVKLLSPDEAYSDVVLYGENNENLLEDESGDAAVSFAQNVQEGQSLARVNLAQDNDASGIDFLPSDFCTLKEVNKFSVDLRLVDFQNLGEKLSVRVENLSVFGLKNEQAKIVLSSQGQSVQEVWVDSLAAGKSLQIVFNLANFSQQYQVWQAELFCELDADKSDNRLALSRLDGASPLLISEVVPSPVESSAEWVELYNCGQDALNLTGVQLADESGKSCSFDLALPSGDFAVLTADLAAFLREYPQANRQKILQVEDLVSLNNSRDVLVLSDGLGAVFDSVSYGKSDADKLKKKQALARYFWKDDASQFFVTDFVTPTERNKFPLSLKLSNLQKLDTKLSTQIHNLSTFDLQPDLARVFLSYNGEIVAEQTLGFLAAGDYQKLEFSVEQKSDFYKVWTVNLVCDYDTENGDNCLVLSEVSSQGVLLINEVMANPGKGCAEWLELYNSDDEKIEIAGMQIRDKSGDVSRFDLSILGKDYLVLVSDLAEFTQTYPQVDLAKVAQVEDLVSLNNSNEVLILEDSLGLCFDSVSYGVVNAPSGVSLEKFGYGDYANVWGDCLEQATPAAANSVRIYEYKDFFAVRVSGEICRKGEPIIISYNVPELLSTVRVQCRVFDLSGRLCRTVGNYRRSAITGELEFDGKDDSGDFLEAGVYSLILTISKGNTLYHKKLYITIK